VAKDEGLFTLWRGSTPTVVRAMMLNLGMMACYDKAKEFLCKRTGEDLKRPSIKVRVL